MAKLAASWWILGFWAALLAAGVVWIRRYPLPPPSTPAQASAACLDASMKSGMPGFTARRLLAINHWIRDADIDAASGTGKAQRSDIVMRYSRCAVKPGERVVASETLELPVIQVPAGRISHVLALSSDSRLASALNAGSTIDVWQNSVIVARRLPVLAVQCPVSVVPPAVDCWAIVAATADEVSRLQQAAAASLRIVAIAATTS